MGCVLSLVLSLTEANTAWFGSGHAPILVCGVYFGDERVNLRANLVANRSHAVDALTRASNRNRFRRSSVTPTAP
jgi:hypothetical protein